MGDYIYIWDYIIIIISHIIIVVLIIIPSGQSEAKVNKHY